MIRFWWAVVAWRRGVPQCRECGRPKGEAVGRYGWECAPCDKAWTVKMRKRREGNK